MNPLSFFTILFLCSSTSAQRGRGFASSILNRVQQVGSQWMQTMQDQVEEAGKVAKVLAGDATDAFHTVIFFYRK